MDRPGGSIGGERVCRLGAIGGESIHKLDGIGGERVDRLRWYRWRE